MSHFITCTDCFIEVFTNIDGDFLGVDVEGQFKCQDCYDYYMTCEQCGLDIHSDDLVPYGAPNTAGDYETYICRACSHKCSKDAG